MKESISTILENSQKAYEHALERPTVNEKELEYLEQLINRLIDARTLVIWLEDFE